jgi:ATP-dependent RNA helicase DeaD
MFNQYSLPERVLEALNTRGITTPTPIQTETLLLSLAGEDIIGQARTGTGKTLAFGLPIASHLEAAPGKGRAPRALVVTPTRELALQVSGELAWLAAHLDIVTIYGGTGYGQQLRALSQGCDVVVATPGRALDYLKRGALNLSQVQIAVLDEADEMLSMGFKEDVETILAATPSERQTLIFSATLPKWTQRLVRGHTQSANHVDVMGGDSVSYRETVMEAEISVRAAVLSDVLHVHGGEGAIIFTNTKAEVDSLRDMLVADGHRVESLHGDLNQVQREDVLGRFRKGLLTALVGTNVAARGLDIPQVDLVVHYRLPDDAANYQHRSGRTGRAGRAGHVVTLASNRERKQIGQFERTLSRRFERSATPRPEQVRDAKLQRALGLAKQQPDDDKAIWTDLAQRLIQDGDHDTLAGLLAAFLGGAPAPRSLLTGEEGQTTLALRGEVRSVGQVVRVLKEAGVQNVGRILLSREGAFADIPTDEHDALAINHEVDGWHISQATQPPQNLVSPQDNPSKGRKKGYGKGRKGGFDKRKKFQRNRSNRSAHAHD